MGQRRENCNKIAAVVNSQNAYGVKFGVCYWLLTYSLLLASSFSLCLGLTVGAYKGLKMHRTSTTRRLALYLVEFTFQYKSNKVLILGAVCNGSLMALHTLSVSCCLKVCFTVSEDLALAFG